MTRLTYNQARDIIKRYVNIRLTNPSYLFSYNDVKIIESAVIAGGSQINYTHPLIQRKTENLFDEKGDSDLIAIDLWNEIMPYDFKVDSTLDLRSAASNFIEFIDGKFPNGKNADLITLIQYTQAMSVSSYIGIQRPSKSKFALDSMISTLESHNKANVVYKEWLMPQLSELSDMIDRYPNIMEVGYERLCLTAKNSSPSLAGFKTFREFVHSNTLDDIVDSVLSGNVPLLIYAGTRSDRRGKYRLICSFDARFRVIDYLLNHGSYSLCEGRGIYSNYTTEGYSNTQLWPELISMTKYQDKATMICIDYSGYDTQISLEEYMMISNVLNKHRLNSAKWHDVIEWYNNWMMQPKPLVTKSSDGIDVLIDVYRTLASGLHATHSFENLIGIATMKQAKQLGIEFYGFWTNGDDQNALINKHHVSLFMDFLSRYFIISKSKSLIGHELKVWSKLWFTSKLYPIWELGTIRSLFEKEGGEINYVEPSKFQSNYCKILQIMIVMIQLGKNDQTINLWCERLCSYVNINPELIPMKLNNLNISTSNKTNHNEPLGLKSVERELRNMSFSIKSLSDNNYYDMLHNTFKKSVYYNLEVDEPEYYPKGSRFVIERAKNYSTMVPKDVPYLYRMLYSGQDYTFRDQFNRDVLQGCKTYDGSCSREYSYENMLTLAKAINDRSKYVWEALSNK